MVAIFGVLVYFQLPEDAAEGATANSLVAFVLPTLLMILPVTLVYFTAFETVNGQTPGKRALGIRVVALEGGGRAPFIACFTRNLLRLLYEAGFPGILFFVVDLFAIEWSEMEQRLGDMAAGTLVVMAASVAERPEPQAVAAPSEVKPVQRAAQRVYPPKDASRRQ